MGYYASSLCKSILPFEPGVKKFSFRFLFTQSYELKKSVS